MTSHPYRLRASNTREFRAALLATIAADHARGAASPTDDPADPHARQVVHVNGRRIGYDATVTDHPHINYLTALDQPQRHVYRMPTIDQLRQQAEMERGVFGPLFGRLDHGAR